MDIVLGVVVGLVIVIQTGLNVILVSRLVEKGTVQTFPGNAEPSILQDLVSLFPGKSDPDTSPMQQDVVDYCDGWADDFARTDCKAKARLLYRETLNWDGVLTSLQRELGDVM